MYLWNDGYTWFTEAQVRMNASIAMTTWQNPVQPMHQSRSLSGLMSSPSRSDQWRCFPLAKVRNVVLEASWIWWVIISYSWTVYLVYGLLWNDISSVIQQNSKNSPVQHGRNTTRWTNTWCIKQLFPSQPEMEMFNQCDFIGCKIDNPWLKVDLLPENHLFMTASFNNPCKDKQQTLFAIVINRLCFICSSTSMHAFLDTNHGRCYPITCCFRCAVSTLQPWTKHLLSCGLFLRKLVAEFDVSDDEVSSPINSILLWCFGLLSGL